MGKWLKLGWGRRWEGATTSTRKILAAGGLWRARLIAFWCGFNDGLCVGAIYGAKVRFPHALVMTVMFREGR